MCVGDRKGGEREKDKLLVDAIKEFLPTRQVDVKADVSRGFILPRIGSIYRAKKRELQAGEGSERKKVEKSG